MGLRFHRSVKLFPGVRLNFSRSGISTTVGVRGAGITIGPRGTYANVGIPGSGLSYRTKISPSAPKHLYVSPPAPNLPRPQPATSPPVSDNEQQIHSAAISAMTSEGLGELKKLINEAALKRIELTHTVQEREIQAEKAERKLAWAKAFIIRVFTQKAIPKLTDQALEAHEHLDEARALLDGCYIDIDFGLDDAASGTFAAMCRSFGELRTSQKIWDITTTAQIDRVKERTTATQRLSRTPVSFDFSHVNIVRSQYQTMRFGNVSGLEVHFFPGFVLTRDSGDDFALIEWKDTTVLLNSSRFIEEETVPSDSQVVGQTWAKANKDGSPDRRFNNNYQIPIAKYGVLWFQSPTGLLEAYMISDYAKTESFALAVSHHRDALARMPDHPPPASIAAQSTDEVENEDSSTGAEVQDVANAPKHFYFDWAALALLIIFCVWSGFWLHENWAALLARTQLQASNEIPAASVPDIQTIESPALPIAYVRRQMINIHSGPSASAQVVTKAKRGTKYSIFEVHGHWSEVGTDKPAGWVLSSLLVASP